MPRRPPRAISLFSGIEGWGLAIEAAGGRVVAQCEIERFCRMLLDLRWPQVPTYGDVRRIRDGDLPNAEVITGGFPCQDLSAAGAGAGLHGARSGLWREMARVIGLVHPRLVLIENVPMLLSRGMERLISDLTDRGYSVEWDCLPAWSVGAPHLRDRVWIVAHRRKHPYVFGPPLDEVEPERTQKGWLRWPRAGFAREPFSCLRLDPLVPRPRDRSRVNLYPTPMAADGERGTTWIGRRDGGNPTLLGAARTWPTPTARDHKGPNRHALNSEGGDDLATAVAMERLWPTPAASDSEGGRREVELGGRRPSGHKRSVSLASAVNHPLWPTPKSSPSGPDYARTDRDRSGGDDLATAVARLPTPTRADSHGSGRRNARGKRQAAADSLRDHVGSVLNEHGQLNPEWVGWLMGFPPRWTDLDTLDVTGFEGWHTEPLPRVLRDAPMRRPRLSAIGNALVPQVAYVVAARAFTV